MKARQALARVALATGFLFLPVLAESSPASPPPEAAVDLEKARQERIGWWRDARYGLFIHWGLYAIPAGTWKDKVYDHGYSEWIMFSEKIPREEYAKLGKRFNPESFDADAWVEVAKQAGMRYVVITAKHHDGFSLFDSKVTDYDVMDATPFRRDIIKELEEACHRAELHFGVYYSVDRDWYRPTGQGNRYKQTNTWDFPDSTDEDFDRYFEEIALPQVKELITQYDIDLLWFDAIEMKSPDQIKRTYDAIRDLSPDTIINSRIWSPVFPKQIPPPYCDYISSGDNKILENSVDFEWENPGSMNTSYGYNRNDHKWVEPDEIIRRLADIVSKGGNYLLNVGPTAEGTFPQPCIDRLLEAGKWMEINEEAIRGASEWRVHSEGDSVYFTAKGNTVYAICTKPPQARLVIEAFNNIEVREVSVLGSEDKIDWKQSDKGLELSAPGKDPHQAGLVYRIVTK
ncbi:alpha-L-fucosidase [Haloferula sp. A504]|uniref:alpha-L-fucosidase n=1 Tax=Haloferula sp. A504 TaxID=3373601 RepID=UPI0031C8036F|nr:alpha-L-fucosidase [Verrucomicrobiaceae bacterium E54]